MEEITAPGGVPAISRGRAEPGDKRVPGAVDAERDHADVIAKVHAAVHQRDQAEVVEASRYQPSQRGLGRP